MESYEMEFENRVVAPEYTGEDSDVEASLRPRTLEEYVGQEKAKQNLAVYIQAACAGERLWTMCSCTALRGWERPPWPASSPTR